VRRYLETFSRHKIALILPIVIALAVSGHQAMSKPHKYVSTMTVWFDNAAPAASSLQDPQLYTSPASQNQAVMQEFLATRQFLVNVGRRGPLASYLTGGHPNHETPAVSEAVDNEMAALLSHAFTISLVGPQVAAVTLTGPTPAYLPGTLTAMATEFAAEVGGTVQAHSSASVAYYQAQVNGAMQTLDQANAAASAYHAAHPGALPTTDSAYSQLLHAVTDAQTNYSSLEGNLQQANLGVANAQSPLSFHMIDPPLGAFEVSNKKHEIFSVGAGLAAGLIISALALSALTALDKTARRQEDIDGVAGMEVVGSIRELPRRARVPALGKAKP
jgi:hypothetical protein